MKKKTIKLPIITIYLIAFQSNQVICFSKQYILQYSLIMITDSKLFYPYTTYYYIIVGLYTFMIQCQKPIIGYRYPIWYNWRINNYNNIAWLTCTRMRRLYRQIDWFSYSLYFFQFLCETKTKLRKNLLQYNNIVKFLVETSSVPCVPMDTNDILKVSVHSAHHIILSINKANEL